MGTFGSCILVAVLATAPSARAQSAGDLETARALYRDARSARDRGDTETALAKFRAAYAVAPTPIIGVELGKTYTQTGLWVEARETFLSVSRIKVASDESEYSARARSEAQVLAEEIRPRIPSIVVAMSKEIKTGYSITLDGNALALELVRLQQPAKVNPGTHTLRAQYTDGTVEEHKLTVAEGATATVPFLGAAAKPAFLAEAPPPPAGGVWTGVMIGGFVVAGAGTLLGTTAGIVALSKSRDFRTLCEGTRCLPAAEPLVANARTWSTVSTIAFVSAGVGVAAGLIGLWLRPSAAQRSAVAWDVGFGSAMVSGRF